jgi:hypothetical protein
MKTWILLPVALMVLYCGSGYMPPSLNPTVFTYRIAGTQADLFEKTRSVLASLGHEFRTANAANGLIMTMPKTDPFRQAECDCGSYYNKPYTVDRASTISVEMTIEIQDGVIKFQTKFSGVQKNRAGKIIRHLECISSGEFEKHLVQLIISKRI